MTTPPLSPSAKAGVTKARRTREAHGIAADGPVPCLLTLVEDRGVAVGILPDLGAGLAGVYLHRSGEPVILLNGSDGAPRLRFTLAHELCHHLFGDQQHVDTHSSMYRSDWWEVRANAFAGELLMPSEAIAAWEDERGGGPIGLDDVVALAERFGTSAHASCIRLKTAGILTDEQRFDRLVAEIKDGEQHWVAGTGYEDSISEARRNLPRLPRAKSVLVEAGRGEMPLEQAAQLLGYAPAKLAGALDSLGFAPPA